MSGGLTGSGGLGVPGGSLGGPQCPTHVGGVTWQVQVLTAPTFAAGRG